MFHMFLDINVQFSYCVFNCSIRLVVQNALELLNIFTLVGYDFFQFFLFVVQANQRLTECLSARFPTA